MFKKGEYVLYETTGVCQIKDISRLDFTKNDRLYYWLVPVFERDTVIYSPVDSDKVKMRSIMSKEEAQDFIEQLPYIESRQCENEKERAQVYKEILWSGDRKAWAAMIKGIFEIGQVRRARGSRLAVRDEEGMRCAQKLLYGELAAALGKTPDEVRNYIRASVSKAEAKKSVQS